MAATMKPRLESDLHTSAPQSPNRQRHYLGGYQCIKTNGSLVHSNSKEEVGMPTVNGESNSVHNHDDDIDDASPQLRDVEALLRGYSNSSTNVVPKEEDDDDDYDERGSSPILLSECPEFQAYLHPLEVGKRDDTQASGNDDEIVFGFLPRGEKDMLPAENDEEAAIWEFIEDEAEAMCFSEEDSSRCHDNGIAQSSDKNSSNRNISPNKVIFGEMFT